jgi:hypothetical protein
MDTEKKGPGSEPLEPTAKPFKYGKLIVVFILVYVAVFVWFGIYR